MKILHVIPYYVPAYSFGGPLTVCASYAEWQAKNGHDVVVATSDVLNKNQRIYKKKEIINGVSVIRFPIISTFLAKNFNLFVSIGFNRWYRNNCKNFDIVHLHDFYTGFNITVSNNSNLQKNFVIQPHGSAVPSIERGNVLVKKLFNKFWGKAILFRSNRVITVSDNESEQILEYVPSINNKVEILKNGIDYKNLKEKKMNLASKKEIRKKYHIAIDSFIFLSFSRIHSVKNIANVIDAYSRLSLNIKTCLVIAGEDAGSLAKLKKQVALLGLNEKVRFFNDPMKFDKYELYKMSDAYLLFSISDPFPMTLLEASSFTLPIGVSRGVGIYSDVIELNAGVVSKSLQSNGIKNAMLHLVRNKDIYKNNTNKLARRYNIDRQNTKLIKIYLK